MSKHERLIDAIIQHKLETGDGDLDHASEYAEPGYTDPEKGILFGNWNPKKFARDGQPEVPSFASRLSRVIKKAELDYNLEWSDEWSTCQDCGRAVRTEADSYSWKPSYVIMNECELVCKGCAQDNLEAYEIHLMNNPNVADTFGTDWSERGWEERDDIYENGFYPGQNDDPRKIAKAIEQERPELNYLFQIGRVGQFDLRFSVWVRPSDYEHEES